MRVNSEVGFKDFDLLLGEFKSGSLGVRSTVEILVDVRSGVDEFYSFVVGHGQ